MSEFQVRPNRYDGSAGIELLSQVSIRGNVAFVEFFIGGDDDIEFYLPAPDGAVDASSLEIARSLLMELPGLDNIVQETCAAECKSTGLHPRNYENDLAYINIDEKGARLHYFGTGVNTEWEERFFYANGKWTYGGVFHGWTRGV